MNPAGMAYEKRTQSDAKKETRIGSMYEFGQSMPACLQKLMLLEATYDVSIMYNS
jgi:hypothetical protein